MLKNIGEIGLFVAIVVLGASAVVIIISTIMDHGEGFCQNNLDAYVEYREMRSEIKQDLDDNVLTKQECRELDRHYQKIRINNKINQLNKPLDQ
jgi:hypothetical protein